MLSVLKALKRKGYVLPVLTETIIVTILHILPYLYIEFPLSVLGSSAAAHLWLVLFSLAFIIFVFH